MTEPTSRQVFPRRDPDGRVISPTELSIAAVAGAVLGVVAVVVIDATFALIGLGEFGRASGWLGLILPVFLFLDDFRAWRAYRIRWLVAPVAAAVALGLGLVVAGLVSGLGALFSGGLAAAVAAASYSVVWFAGIRWLSGHRGME